MRVRSDPKNEVAASHTNDITEKGGGFQRCRFVGRSNNNANANGGLVYANANNGSANSNTNIGSRLAFRGKIKTRISIKSLLRKIIMEW